MLAATQVHVPSYDYTGPAYQDPAQAAQISDYEDDYKEWIDSFDYYKYDFRKSNSLPHTHAVNSSLQGEWKGVQMLLEPQK